MLPALAVAVSLKSLGKATGGVTSASAEQI